MSRDEPAAECAAMEGRANTTMSQMTSAPCDRAAPYPAAFPGRAGAWTSGRRRICRDKLERRRRVAETSWRGRSNLQPDAP